MAITEKLEVHELMEVFGFDQEVPRQGYKVIGEVPADLREEWEDLAFEAQELYFFRPGKKKLIPTPKDFSKVDKDFFEKNFDRAENLFKALTERVPGFKAGKTRLFAGWVLANRIPSPVEWLYAIDEMARFTERPWDFPDRDFPCMRRCH